jgi:hypothetical protein
MLGIRSFSLQSSITDQSEAATVPSCSAAAPRCSAVPLAPGRRCAERAPDAWSGALLGRAWSAGIR